MNTPKIAILGCGNIGSSILEGFLKTGMDPDNLVATRRTINPDIQSDIRIIRDNIYAVKQSDIIIIAVKSYNFPELLKEIKGSLDTRRHIIISLSTGVTVSRIKTETSEDMPVFRAMPNISASVNSSVTCISHNNESVEKVIAVKNLFGYLGAAMIIEENLMESATILGSCGIAYVLRFIRAMIQGGIQIGFDAATASSIVNHTVKGAAELLITGLQHPEKEIDRVTTPKGCTIVGLNEMEHNGFSSSLIKGIVASFEKIER